MAITVHNTGQGIYSLTSGASVNISNCIVHDVPQRYMVCAIALQTNTGSVTAGSVVYRAETGNASTDQSLTFLGADSHSSTGIRIEYWGLLAPAVSINTPTVRFTSSVTCRGAAGVVVYQGVDQTTPYLGYPSTPTNFTSVEGTTLASPAGNTSDLSVTTNVANEWVVSAVALNSSATTNNHKCLTGTDIVNRLSGTTTGNTVRIGMAHQVQASAGTATVTWRTYGGGTAAYGAGQSGRAFTLAGFGLRPSTSVAPYWVMPPSEPLANANADITICRWVDLSDWPSVGKISWSSPNTGGPSEYTAANDMSKRYTSRTSTAILAGVSVGTNSLGSVGVWRASEGYAGGASIDVYLPSTIQENDIMIVTVYTEDNTIIPTQASFTQINTQTTSNMRQTNFWKRMSATDASNAATPANNTKYTFTTTGASWRTVTAAWYRGCITSRTPYINSTDDAGDSALPTTNTGTTGSPSFTGLTTSAADQTLVFLGTHFSGPTWAPALASGSMEERDHYFNTYIGDRAMTATGAVPTQTVTTSVTTNTWATTVITLIPAVTTTTHQRSVTAMNAVATARSVSRLMDNYNRAVAAMSAVATTRSASRRMLPYKRAVAAMNAVATARTVANVLRYGRSVQAMNAVATARSVTRRATYKRTVNGGAQPIIFITLDRTHIGGADIFVRAVASMSAVATARSVSRRATYRRAIAAMSAVATVRTVSRRQFPVKRSVASLSGITTARSVARRMTFKRSVTATSGIARVVTVSRTLQTGVVGWVDYQPAADTPYIFRIEDIPTTYPGCVFNLLVQMRSLDNAKKVYARLVTSAGSEVAGSQIETASPYDAWQQVRSGSLNLVSNTYYKVQVGKVSPNQGQIRWAKLAVRDVA